MDLSLRTLICMTHDDLGEHPLCPTAQAFVESANAAWKGARIRHDRIEAAHQLVVLALADFEAGAPRLSDSSAFARNALSDSGWAVLEELVRAARLSLMSGNTAVPHVAPALHADLRSFFASPPDPSRIAEPLMTVHGGDCEDVDCEADIAIQARHVGALFDDTDADFVDGDYEFAETSSDSLEDAVREVLLQLDSGLFQGG